MMETVEEGILNAQVVKSVQAGDDNDQAMLLESSSSSRSLEGTGLFRMNSSSRWRRRRRTAGQFAPLVKAGLPSVQRNSVERQRYFQDFFLTAVQWKWRYSLLFVSVMYVLCWLVFAGFWLAVPDDCVVGTENFTSAFLLSVELQTTIGFGNIYVRQDCRVGAFLLTVQCVVGLVLDALLLGLILTKAARAKSRSKTVFFSKKAVICQRNGEMCLLFRVADMRNRSMCEAHARVYCYSSRATREGEHLDWEYQELDVGYDTGRDRLLMILPCTVCHKINKSSPFYRMNAEELASADFEIIALVEGVIEATGCTAQVLTSYEANDVLWAHRFLPMVFRDDLGRLTIDYDRLDDVITDNSPRCAPCELESENAVNESDV